MLQGLIFTAQSFFSMKHLSLLLVVFCLLPVVAFAKFKKITLREALANNEITLKAENINGQFNGKTTKLSITNQSKHELGVVVELGTILKPGDSMNQPMILAKEEYVLLQPSGTRHVEVMTFCGNVKKHGPEKGAGYSYWKQASDTLVEVLKFALANKLETDLAQEAVWVITNNRPVSEVYHPDMQIRKKLTEMLVKYTSQPLPDYYTIHDQPEQPGQPLQERKALKIMADFNVPLEAPAVLTLGVYNSKGDMIQKVFERQEFRRAIHNFTVEFGLEDAPPGKYYIRLTDDSRTIKEQMVEVK
jgi:hypothetical protein